MNTNVSIPMPDAVDRIVSTAVNGFEVARYGGLRTDETSAPYEVIAHERVYRLRHYFPDAPSGRRPVLLVPPLMQVAEVWDLSPATSAVTQLHEQGIDPWVVDFGDPNREPGGGRRTFSDHVLAVAEAVGRVREATGQDVHIGGYSQGGIFCYLAAAYRSCEHVASIFALGSPLQAISLDAFVPEKLLWDATHLSGKVLGRTGLPRRAVQGMFNWANPARTIKADIDFLLALHDRESLVPREPQRKFLKRGAWIGWSGPAIEEMLEVIRADRLMEGGAVIGDRTVGLSDITCPVLIFIGEADSFAPVPAVRAIAQAAPKAEVYECLLPVGHFGLPVSSHAKAKTWPGVVAFTQWCLDGTGLPAYIQPLTADDDGPVGATRRGPAASLTYGLGLAAEAGITAPRVLARSGQRACATVRELSLETIAQVPRLVRLERMRPGTRVSYGAMLDDAARSRGDDVAILFADHAHTHADVKRRIDDVVRGLISVGIRRGEHVGVLMDMRPSAAAAVAALNRLGAVAVLLRPGEDTAREIEHGQVTRVIADPEHAAAAAKHTDEVYVLGGGAGPRGVPPSIVDLERIDPHAVELPAWYRPNPGRARDLAFILFSGHGANIRADRITNGRWATSALVASTAAALTRDDTIYAANPMHHPSGLLLATGAAAASGARLAMATGFDPDTFWSEVRRYGATVVPYTWAMLHSLVAAPAHPEERHHPIRLFVGSGMPAGVWRRVKERFGDASVLELYASTRTHAILGNVSDRKAGALGQPMPGTPAVAVVQYDPATGRPRTGRNGYAVRCEVNVTGLMLVAAPAETQSRHDVALRGVFSASDAWIATGALVRCDADGDLWLVDHLAALVPTKRGTVSPRTIERALGELDAVDLAACYPVRDPASGDTLAVAAVTLRPERTLNAKDLHRAFEQLEPAARPDFVHVLPTMPMTSWYRPALSELQAAGVPDSRYGVEIWRLSPRSGRYLETSSDKSPTKTTRRGSNGR